MISASSWIVRMRRRCHCDLAVRFLFRCCFQGGPGWAALFCWGHVNPNEKIRKWNQGLFGFRSSFGIRDSSFAFRIFSNLFTQPASEIILFCRELLQPSSLLYPNCMMSFLASGRGERVWAMKPCIIPKPASLFPFLSLTSAATSPSFSRRLRRSPS